MKKNKKEQPSPVEKRVDTLIKLIAIGITYGKNLGDQATMLSNAGFRPKEIALLLRKTSRDITNALYEKKRKPKRKKKKSIQKRKKLITNQGSHP